MSNAILVTGRLIGPRTVELDEPAPAATGPVEVILRNPPATSDQGPSLSAFLRQLPPGTRQRDDINQQVQQERDSWGDR